MRRLPVIALIAALATAAAPAHARVVHYKNFASPSKQISCISVKYGGRGIECSATYIKDIGELDTYYALEPHGRSRIGQRGDYPGYPGARQRTLHYGDTYRRHGIRCRMRTSGMTCRNRDHHGFHLARGDVRRF